MVARARVFWLRLRLVAAFVLACGLSCTPAKKPELTVLVVAAIRGMPLEGKVPVIVKSEGWKSEASAREPARFFGVKPGQNVEIEVGGDYRANPVTVKVGVDGIARAELRVVPVTRGEREPPMKPGSEKLRPLEVDLTLPWLVLFWREGQSVYASTTVAGPPAELPKAFRRSWLEYAVHQSASDAARDPARLLILPGTDLARVVEVANALMAVERNFARGDARLSGPAFTLTIQEVEPLPPKRLAEVIADVEPVTRPEYVEEDFVRQRAGAINALGFRLYATAAKAPGNVAVSPVGLATSAAILHRGAAGDTASQLEALFGASDRQRSPSKDVAAMLTMLGGSHYHAMVNALWVGEPTAIHAEYESAIGRDLRASVAVTNLGDGLGAAKVINDFIAERTWARVRDPVDPSAWAANTSAMLVGVAHSRERWNMGFMQADTTIGDFHVTRAKRVPVPLMHRRDRFLPRRGDGYTTLRLATSVTHEVLLILPREGRFESVESRFEQILLESYQGGISDPENLTLTLPRFEVHWRASLVPFLRSVGVTDAFDPEKADFAGLTSSRGFAVTDVVHAVSLVAKEAGIGVDGPPSRRFGRRKKVENVTGEISFNRPFLFAIYDRETKAVLMLGRVLDPGSGVNGLP